MRPDAAAFDAAKVHGPGDLEVLHIVLVDLRKAGEAGGGKILVVMEPVAGLLIRIEQPLGSDLVRRLCRQRRDRCDRGNGCEHGGSQRRLTSCEILHVVSSLFDDFFCTRAPAYPKDPQVRSSLVRLFWSSAVFRDVRGRSPRFRWSPRAGRRLST